MADEKQLETLKKGANAWSKWRNENPCAIPNLERALLEGVRLAGADLRLANLKHADLRKSQGLAGTKLGGANLLGAHMPEEFPESALLARINDAVKYAERAFLVVLIGSVYTWLTIATTSDALLVTNIKSASLPILQTEISIRGFYLVAPFLLLCAYVYFQIYLQRLWERLADAPAVFPDGRTLGAKVSPWFFTGLIYSHFVHLRENSPPLATFQFWVCILLIWVLLPIITLPSIWLRYLPAYDSLGTIFHIVLVLIGFGFGIFTFVHCRSTLRNRLINSKYIARGCFWSTLAVGVLLLLVSYAALNGVHRYFTLMDEDQRGQISSENIPNQASASSPLNRWVPRILAYIQSPFPYLVNAQLSETPEDRLTNLNAVKGAQLVGANLRYANLARAYIVNGNLEGAILERANLRGADFRGANLAQANLNDAYLMGARFEHSKLAGAHLNRSYLLETRLENADLTGAQLGHARLHGAHLGGAKLVRADLRDAQFQPANMGWLEFPLPGSRTNTITLIALKGADFTGANLELARLERADLRGVTGLTQEQINAACFDKESKLPGGLLKPPPCPAPDTTKVFRENPLPR